MISLKYIKTQYQLFRHVTIFFLIISILPLNSLIVFTNSNISNYNSLKTEEHVKNQIEKLIRVPNMNSSCLVEPITKNDFDNLKIPILDIGTKIGNGEGIYQIYDSLLKLNSTSLIIQNILNQGTPSVHLTNLLIDTLENFSRNSLDFQIFNVTAEEDWRRIESEVFDSDQRYSTAFIEVAQNFEIKEDYANITRIEVYITYNDLVFNDGNIPHGNISIFSDNLGEPGIQLGTMTLEEGFGSRDLGQIGPAWVTYTFSKPISVSKGSYWLVLNDTGNQAFGYWQWYSQNASNGDPGPMLARSSHGGSWATNPFPEGDILSAIRVLPTDSSWNRLTYTNPKVISMRYNTTMGEYELLSFNFPANDTLTHNLYTNTSVSFDLINLANFSWSNNPLSGYSMYKVLNGSDTLWNLTFSTSRVVTNDIIKNRTIRINGFYSDWNGSVIYWNDSSSPEYTDLTNNQNITWDGNLDHLYTYGNTTMVINASSLTKNVSWTICFIASNYISSFELKRNSLPMNLPYKANVTDIVDIIFSVEEPGGNASFWAEYSPTDDLVFQHSNIDYSGKLVTDSWNINSTLSQVTNINGSYELQVFWINANRNKVGTFIRALDLYVNTSFNVKAASEIIIGELLNVTALYKSIHNGTDIKNAKIWCDASWASATDVFMAQNSINYSYHANFITSNQIAGELGNITINTQVGWFVNWTKTIFVKFVENSSLSINITSNVLEWHQNTTIYINYLNSSGYSIKNAIIKVNGSLANYNSTLDTYFYVLNTSDYSGVGLFLDIPVTANHSEFFYREDSFSFTITPGKTSIRSNYNNNPFLNKTEIFIPFANSSTDSLLFDFQYYQILTGNNLSINLPEIESIIPYTNPIKQADNSWIITFDPHQPGNFTAKIAFNLFNYFDSVFVFNIIVQNPHAQIQTGYTNNTQIFYTESFDFSVFFQNTDWNENITFDDSDSIIISDETKISYLNRTGDDYWFKFSPTIIPIGQYSIQISFSYVYFEESVLTVVFNVIDMPTLSIPNSVVHLTNNGSIIIEELLGITIDEYTTIRNNKISTIDEVFLWLNGTSVPPTHLINLKLTEAPFSFNFSTAGWNYGSYNLTLQIKTLGYQFQGISLNITLNGRKTNIIIEIDPGKNIQQGENITFIVTIIYTGGSMNGFGAEIRQDISLEGIEISYFIVLEYKNRSTQVFEKMILTDESGKAKYTLEGYHTKGAIGFSNITIQSSSGLSALPAMYTMPGSELASYIIIPPVINIFEVIVTVIIIISILLISAAVTGITVRTIRDKRSFYKELILKNDASIEKSFEDIKSIRLILAKHESGLQFYSEKTISDFQADTDALSGMSTAISQFIEDVSGRMQTRNENGTIKEKIETISREGFHMLIWNGNYSSWIIISELPLPDYYRDRIESLGKEIEKIFEKELKGFFEAETLQQSVIKKVVRKYIPLHYFSAFVLNEGVLTLKNIRLTQKDKKMFSNIKNLYFERQGIQYFFSEQIISHLAMKYKRSEAITFLERIIDLTLVVECSQEELLQLGQ